ncbi:hypothetical protein E8E14_005792 [Neopestalotiopsis sp. 37M]|nr:hypothetical protein E8E14_005792 [Neopestalotiopsis sp. 37M]
MQQLGQNDSESFFQVAARRYTGGDAALYLAAANSFRIPFWDWATDSNLPPATTWPEITVNAPGGQQTVPNPLYSFVWPSFPLDHDPAWFPTTDDAVLWNSTGTQRQLSPRGNLSLVVTSLQDKVYSVFAKTKDFDVMASTANPGPSFEDPHNDVHNAAGTFMYNPLYSAFDPIFWLHHANVDRLYALWQAINYNTTYQSKPAAIGSGTWAQPPGTQMTAESPLAPFYQPPPGYSGGSSSRPQQAQAQTLFQFHTGKTTASLRTFGYTYPEINDWSLSPDRTRQLVIRQVNALYGPNLVTPPRPLGPQSQPPPPASPHQSGGSGPPSGSPSSRHRFRQNRERRDISSSSSDASSVSSAPPRQKRQKQKQRQYYVQVGVERSELSLPCEIRVLLGDGDGDGDDNNNTVVAGSAAIMALPPAGMTHAEIQLNRGIERFTPCVEDKTVVPLLEQRLRRDGTPIAADSVPSLTINVESVDVELPDSDDELPSYGPRTTYPKIGVPSGKYSSSTRRDHGSVNFSNLLALVNLIRTRLSW